MQNTENVSFLKLFATKVQWLKRFLNVNFARSKAGVLLPSSKKRLILKLLNSIQKFFNLPIPS